MNPANAVSIREIFNLQYAQQERIHGPLPDDRVRQRALAHRFATAAQSELVGYLDAIAYKDFLPGREKPRSTRLIELVDAFKYVLATAWTEGISAAEFLKAFEDKTRTVDQMWEQRALRGEKVCSFDMDGVLCEYNVSWGPTEEEFCERGGVLEIPCLDGARELLTWLKSKGWTIVITTARKRWLIQRLDGDTREWLRRHGIPFDAIIFNHDKGYALEQLGVEVYFHVDDKPKHAIDVVQHVQRSYLLNPHFAPVQLDDPFTVVTDLGHLRDELEAWFGELGI